jgi:hypothetical protein
MAVEVGSERVENSSGSRLGMNGDKRRERPDRLLGGPEYLRRRVGIAQVGLDERALADLLRLLRLRPPRLGRVVGAPAARSD